MKTFSFFFLDKILANTFCLISAKKKTKKDEMFTPKIQEGKNKKHNKPNYLKTIIYAIITKIKISFFSIRQKLILQVK